MAEASCTRRSSVPWEGFPHTIQAYEDAPDHPSNQQVAEMGSPHHSFIASVGSSAMASVGTILAISVFAVGASGEGLPTSSPPLIDI